MKTKQKYWYVTDVYACVLCGGESKYKHRVYVKPVMSINWSDTACDYHFI